jgi:hypothetical protein
MSNNVNVLNTTQLAEAIEAARVLAAAPVQTAPSTASLKAAAADSKVVFTGAGRIIGFVGNSTYSTAIHWLMGFDSATLPANGTRPDLPGVEVATTGGFSGTFDGDDGMTCVNGWVFALSTTQATLTVTTGSYMSILASYRDL